MTVGSELQWWKKHVWVVLLIDLFVSGFIQLCFSESFLFFFWFKKLICHFSVNNFIISESCDAPKLVWVEHFTRFGSLSWYNGSLSWWWVCCWHEFCLWVKMIFWTLCRRWRFMNLFNFINGYVAFFIF